MKTNKEDEKVMSMNETLPEFYLENLEERLETDPLNVGSMFKVEMDGDLCWGYDQCNGENGCIQKESCDIHI